MKLPLGGFFCTKQNPVERRTSRGFFISPSHSSHKGENHEQRIQGQQTLLGIAVGSDFSGGVLALAGFAGGDYADAGCAMTNLTNIRFWAIWAIFALLALGYVLGQLAAFVK